MLETQTTLFPTNRNTNLKKKKKKENQDLPIFVVNQNQFPSGHTQ